MDQSKIVIIGARSMPRESKMQQLISAIVDQYDIAESHLMTYPEPIAIMGTERHVNEMMELLEREIELRRQAIFEKEFGGKNCIVIGDPGIGRSYGVSHAGMTDLIIIDEFTELWERQPWHTKDYPSMLLESIGSMWALDEAVSLSIVREKGKDKIYRNGALLEPYPCEAILNEKPSPIFDKHRVHKAKRKTYRAKRTRNKNPQWRRK